MRSPCWPRSVLTVTLSLVLAGCGQQAVSPQVASSPASDAPQGQAAAAPGTLIDFRVFEELTLLDVASDQSGNVYTSGQSGSSSGRVLKLTPSLGTQWNKEVSGGGRANATSNLAADGAGNVYSVNVKYVHAGREETLSKMDASGNVVWQKTNNQDFSGAQNFLGVAVDEAGNVYVSGSECCLNGGGSSTPRIDRYTTAGQLVWRKNIDRPGPVAADEQGNLYHAAPGVHLDKYSPEGWELFSKPFDSSPDSLAEQVRVAQGGSVYTLWTSGNKEYLKNYDVRGHWHWNIQLPDTAAPPFGLLDQFKIAPDKLGNVYVASSSFTEYEGSLAISSLTKYDQQGRAVWSTKLSSLGFGQQLAPTVHLRVTGLTVNANGEVVVAFGEPDALTTGDRHQSVLARIAP